MTFSRSFVVVVTVILLVILLGVIFIELHINSKSNILVVSDAKLSIYYNLLQQYLKVDAKITNIGRVNVTNIVLSIQTFFKNGTKSADWEMILWQNVTVPTTYSGINPINVTISSGQS